MSFSGYEEGKKGVMLQAAVNFRPDSFFCLIIFLWILIAE